MKMVGAIHCQGWFRVKCHSQLILSLFTCLILGQIGCAVDDPGLQPSVVVAIFNPQVGNIATPNDILFDRAAHRIAIPATPEDLAKKTPLEGDIIQRLNHHRGWSTRSTAKLNFSGPLAPESVSEESFLIWEYAPNEEIPSRLVAGSDYQITLYPTPGLEDSTQTTLEVSPSIEGWKPGHRYTLAAIGGENGLRGEGGKKVVADAAYWFLRLKKNLIDNASALPGKDMEEKLEKAEKLESIRLDLQPHFEFVESIGIARKDIAHLWSFEITDAPEILMDKTMGKMPLPSDFLRNPFTGKIELPIRETDTPFEADNKAVINTYDGFGLSSNLFFETSKGLSDAALQSGGIRLYELKDGGAREIEIEVEGRRDNTFILIKPVGQILEPETVHVMAITHQIQDSQGRSVEPMMPGVLALAKNPVFAQNESQLAVLERESAAKVELVRSGVHKGLAQIDTAGLLPQSAVAAAWSFKTLSVVPEMLKWRDAPNVLDTNPNPTVRRTQSSFEAAFEFPVGITSMMNVGDVHHGTIIVPDFLDPNTRSKYPDGHWNPREVHFTMTIPRNAERDKKLKVAIFGHAIVTERRMALGPANALASEGLATISIDFPYHGERTHCSFSGPLCFVNPLDQDGDLLCPNPCASGTTCADDGRCVDNGGQGNERSTWPIIPMYQNSGSVFIDMHHLGGTVDHFYQSITDLSALLRSLKLGNWEDAIGYEIDPDVSYAGQSLGGIIGALYAAAEPSIDQVVLNVPGGDLVELMRESDWFGPQFDHFLGERNIQPGTIDHEMLLNLARWMIDPVDPQTFTPYLKLKSIETGAPLDDRAIMIQMATMDFIIKNAYTEFLAEWSEIPRYDYIAEHAFVVVPIEPAYFPGNEDLARLLARRELP